MNQHNTFAKSRRAHVFIRAVIASTVLLAIPACRIPGLRGASHGNPVPETFNVSTDPEMDGETINESFAQVELHTFFNDPMLTSLIDRAFCR